MRGTPFLLKGWTGGLNTIDSPYTLQPTETRECLNVVSTERGAIRKRYGSTKFTQPTPIVEFESLFAATINNVPWLVAAGEGKIYSINNSGIITEIGKGFTPDVRWSMVQAPESKEVGSQGPVYMTNGVDKAQSWTGTGNVKEWTGKKETLTYANAPYVPQGQYMVFAGNRIWMTGIKSDPSAVWFTETVSLGEGGAQADPSFWLKTNVVRFDSSDGQPITGIGTVGPYILVFKEHKTWVIHNINTGENRKLADNIGCVAHRSIVESTQGTFFLTADQGVYLTNGSSLHEMSYNVRPTILNINPSERANAAGEYLNNHYYLSFASGTSNINNRTLDYDAQLKSWWLHDLAGNQWVHWEPVAGEISLYTIPPEIQKGVVKAFVPGIYTDSEAVYPGNGQLAAFWVSPWDPFAYYIFRHRIEAPFLKKRVRAIFFDGEGEINPLVFKNFQNGPTGLAAVVANNPESDTEYPVMFEQGETIWANPDIEQIFGGDTYKGVQMIFGGNRSVQDARIYAPGVARVWSVGFGNNSAEPFVVDSFAYFVQFRKS